MELQALTLAARSYALLTTDKGRWTTDRQTARGRWTTDGQTARGRWTTDTEGDRQQIDKEGAVMVQQRKMDRWTETGRQTTEI